MIYAPKSLVFLSRNTCVLRSSDTIPSPLRSLWHFRFVNVLQEAPCPLIFLMISYSTSPTWRLNAMNHFATLEDPMRATSEICP